MLMTEEQNTQHPGGDQGSVPEEHIVNTRSRKLRSASATTTTKGDESKTTESLSPSPAKRQDDRPDHAYASGGRVLRKKRKSTTSEGTSTTCTVCGVTVRPSELHSHYEWEVDKLNRMLRPDGTRYRDGRYDHKEKRKSSSTGSSAKKKKDSADLENEEDIELDPEERQSEFERVKSRRQERLYSRVRKSMRANLESDDGPSTSSANSDDKTTCPICQIELTGTAEERNNHAEACLLARTSIAATNEDEDVDIEGESYEEYTWCGQTRVRATSLLEKGYKGLGYEVGNQSTDVDTELNIESDDESAEFGPAQFTEADIIPCASDEMNEEMQRLRNAVLEGSQERVPPLHPDDSTHTNNNDTNASVQNQDDPPAESSSSPTSPNTKETFQSCNPLYPGHSRTVLQSLRARIEELEDLVNKQNSVRCLICMESYKTPTASVQCWHVHCQECWLRTLGAKKLCPQCNMITSPNQLRQIYL